MERSGTSIRLVDEDDPYWNGFGWWYEAEVMGLDFSAERLVTSGTTFRCSDGTHHHNRVRSNGSLGPVLGGRAGIEGWLRISWRQSTEDIDLDTLTWVWTATQQ